MGTQHSTQEKEEDEDREEGEETHGGPTGLPGLHTTDRVARGKSSSRSLSLSILLSEAFIALIPSAGCGRTDGATARGPRAGRPAVARRVAGRRKLPIAAAALSLRRRRGQPGRRSPARTLPSLPPRVSISLSLSKAMQSYRRPLPTSALPLSTALSSPLPPEKA